MKQKHNYTDLFKFLGLVKVGYLPTTQYIVDIFEERFF